MEEIGRNLMPSPFLATAVLAASALLRGGSAAQQAEHLPKIADGSLLASLAIDEGVKHRPLMTKMQAVRSGNGFRLQGDKAFVVDGHTAGSPDRGGAHRGCGRRARRVDAVSGRSPHQGHRDRTHRDGRFAQCGADQVRFRRGQRRRRARRGRPGRSSLGRRAQYRSRRGRLRNGRGRRGGVRPNRRAISRNAGNSARRSANSRRCSTAPRSFISRSKSPAPPCSRRCRRWIRILPMRPRRWRWRKRAQGQRRRWPFRRVCRCMAAWA